MQFKKEIIKKILYRLPLYLLTLEIALFSLYLSYHFYPWDIKAYVLNGKYFIHQSKYFEVYRPPLMPLIFAFLYIFLKNDFLLLIFYVALSSLLFLFAIEKLLSLQEGRKTNAWVIVFLVLLLNPLFTSYSFIPSGSEILSMALFLLGSYYLLNNESKRDAFLSGLLFSLASLTRYNFLIYSPLLLLHKKIKKIVYALASFSLPWIVWMIYNKHAFGRFLYSFVNAYALNIYFRNDIVQSITLKQFLFMAILVFFFIIASIYTYKHIKKRNEFLIKIWIISSYALVVSIFMFLKTPIKIDRYLYSLNISLILIGMIFSALMNNRIKRKGKYIFGLLTIIGLLFLSYLQYNDFIEIKHHYIPIKDDFIAIKHYLSQSNIKCIYSDYWVYYNDQNLLAFPLGFLFNSKTRSYNISYVIPSCNYIIVHETPSKYLLSLNITKMEVHFQHHNTNIFYVDTTQSSTYFWQKYRRKYDNKVVIDTIFKKSIDFKDSLLYNKVCHHLFIFLSPLVCS